MADVSIQRGIGIGGLRELVARANASGPDFVRQFAGPALPYPLDAQALNETAEESYSVLVDGSFAGMVQVIRTEGTNAHVGRFMLNQDLRGAGIGAKALDALCRVLFEREALQSISLNVYAFNEPARHCYRKAGFSEEETTPGEFGWEVIRMVRRRAVRAGV